MQMSHCDFQPLKMVDPDTYLVVLQVKKDSWKKHWDLFRREMEVHHLYVTYDTLPNSSVYIFYLAIYTQHRITENLISL